MQHTILILTAALLLAGCVSGAPDDLAPAAALSPEAAPVMTSVPIAHEGSTPDAASACAPGFCYGAGRPGSSSWIEPKLDGLLVGANLTLTWEARTPATETLLLGIAYATGADSWDYVYVRGPSPLVLERTGLAIEGKDVEAVYVNGYRCEVAVCASTSQPFTLEGALVLQQDQP